MTDIRVPTLNANDQDYVLLEWLVDDGQPVAVDDAIAVLETSKAAEDLVCDDSGILWQLLPVGARCAPGAVIGEVVSAGTARTRTSRPTTEQPTKAGLLITRPAQLLIAELGIDPDRIRELGIKVIRRSDVQRLAAAPTSRPAPSHPLSAGQRSVAETVERSHQSIPAAYSAIKIDISTAQTRARTLGAHWRKPVGVPEILIAAVAPLHLSFPVFFATPMSDHNLRLPDDSHVGVTIDAGRGLFVPVVKNASRQTLADIVSVVGEFRLTALTGTFREGDLAGGNITVALHHDADVVLAIPLIQPGQTCCLALTSAQQELFQTPQGQLRSRSVTNLGLAYDHRFVNGRDANLFLRAVKDILEDIPEDIPEDILEDGVST
jgi:2-oxoglutarate dehydrogenase E2 component (dihydrolipoamide succinyltransferase)